MGNYSKVHAGAAVSEIWTQIASFQQAFRVVYETTAYPLDEYERASEMLSVQHHLNEHCQIGFDRGDDAVWSIRPNGALGAAWIQLANHAANPRAFKACACPGCSNLFTADKSRGQPKKYCGDPCKAKAGRLRRASP